MLNPILKYIVATLFLSVVASDLLAQGVNISTDFQDVRFAGKTYNNLIGSPFLFEDWVEGSVILIDGTEFKGLKINFNQIKEEVLFALPDNKTKVFMHPVRQFSIEGPNSKGETNRIFKNGFASIDGGTQNSFYEILADGSLSLVKRTSKSIVEERADGQTFKTKQIRTNHKYYVAQGTQLSKAPRDKKTFLSMLPDQSKILLIDEYLTKNNTSLKDEQALTQAIAYYNSLK
jgi:hypothetical protein